MGYVNLLSTSQKCQGVPFSPNLSKTITFAAAPLALTPFVRNQKVRDAERIALVQGGALSVAVIANVSPLAMGRVYLSIYLCLSLLSLSLYIYIYIYISICVCIYIYIYSGFPRPVTTKCAKANTFCERNEENKTYESKKQRGSIKQAYPTLLGMLAWRASGYA